MVILCVFCFWLYHQFFVDACDLFSHIFLYLYWGNHKVPLVPGEWFWRIWIISIDTEKKKKPNKTWNAYTILDNKNPCGVYGFFDTDLHQASGHIHRCIVVVAKHHHYVHRPYQGCMIILSICIRNISKKEYRPYVHWKDGPFWTIFAGATKTVFFIILSLFSELWQSHSYLIGVNAA